MAAIAEVFRALGEPTRLRIVEQLSKGDMQTISTISHGLKMSRQGARKHLHILEEARVVTLVPKGRSTVVQLEWRTIERSKGFIQRLESEWEKRLEKLRDFVER